MKHIVSFFGVLALTVCTVLGQFAEVGKTVMYDPKTYKLLEPKISSSNLFAGAGTTGSVGSATGDAGKFLRADGSWQTAGGGITWDAGTGLTNAGTSLAVTGQLNAASILSLSNAGNAYSWVNANSNTVASNTVLLVNGTNNWNKSTNLFAGSGTTGVVTSAAGDAGKYLRADNVWQSVGDVFTASNNTFVSTKTCIFNGTNIYSGTNVFNNTIQGTRSVWGQGLSPRPSLINGVGAVQHGFSSGGGMVIGASDGAGQYGTVDNSGGGVIMKIGTTSSGASQHGVVTSGSMVISNSCWGAVQFGAVALGDMVIGRGAASASQFGQIVGGALATNSGIGAMQIFSLIAGQAATTTASGASSLLIGAGTSSNKNCIVVGDLQQSHGSNSITSGGGFWDGEMRLGTNLFAGAGTTGSVGSVAGDAGKFLMADGTWQINTNNPAIVFSNATDNTGITMTTGVRNGTNAMCFICGGTNYWILLQ